MISENKQNKRWWNCKKVNWSEKNQHLKVYRSNSKHFKKKFNKIGGL